MNNKAEEITNPLLIAMDKIIEEVNPKELMEEVGASIDEITEFLSVIISNTVEHTREVEGVGHVLDLDDIGFMILLGVNVGMVHARAQKNETERS